MNQEQLNFVVDTYNEAKQDALKKGYIKKKPTKAEDLVLTFISSMSCYLSVYKELAPDTYDIAKKILQNVADMYTLNIDISDNTEKEEKSTIEEQHLIYVGD